MSEEQPTEVVEEPINPDSLLTPEEAYSVCIKREHDREYKWRKSAQGDFESSMESLDTLTDSFDDPSKVDAFSDRGYGAYAIERYYDGEGAVYRSQRCIKTARMYVSRKHKELLEVFNLVLKNGTNRKESIWQMVKNQCLKKRKSSMRPRCDTSTTSVAS